MEGVVKKPLEVTDSELDLFAPHELNGLFRQPKEHYSKSANHQWVFGTKKVYTDLKVTNEDIIINIKG